MTPKTTYQVYAYCEGIWHTPAWMMAVQLSHVGTPKVVCDRCSRLLNMTTRRCLVDGLCERCYRKRAKEAA